MSAEQLDKDILATMSEEERLIMADGMSEEEKAAIPDPGEDDDDDDDDESVVPAAEVPAKAEAETVAPVESPAPIVGVEDHDIVSPVDEVRTTRATYKSDLPHDYADRVKALVDADRNLALAFKDGDVDFDGFSTQSAALNRERHDLSIIQVKSEIAAEMGAQTAEQEWQGAIDSFMAAASKLDGIDYKADAKKQKDLDMFVKALAADDDNADKSMQWFLDEAHRIVKAKHGVVSAPAVPTVAAKADKARKSPVNLIPSTLANVPGSDGPGDVGDEYAEIDRLDGMEYEMAIAKMSPAQRNKYLQAA